MVDVDIRAVKQSRVNARLNQIGNVEILASEGLAEIPKEVKFDIILSNPPGHAPKEMLADFFNQAKLSLTKQGKIYLVIEKRLMPMYKKTFIGLCSRRNCPTRTICNTESN